MALFLRHAKSTKTPITISKNPHTPATTAAAIVPVDIPEEWEEALDEADGTEVRDAGALAIGVEMVAGLVGVETVNAE